jgi:two-component system cell cycle sensor histidine kinase/response regulator CckA
MNDKLLISIINNAALLLSLGLIYDVFYRGKQITHPLLNKIASGLVIGVIAVVLMATPARWETGIIFDTRTILLGVTGLFFSTVPTLIAMTIAGAYRLNIGGGGTLMGIATIISSGLIGLAWRQYRFRESKEFALLELYLFGWVVHAAMILCMLLLPQEVIQRTISTVALPVILIYPVCTALLGYLLTTRQRRHRAEEALQRSEERHRTILQTAMDGIWRVDMQGRLEEVNDTYCRMSGYSKQELLSMSINDLEVNETADDTVAHLQKVREQGEGRFESRHRRKNGTFFYVEIGVKYQPVNGGEIVAFIHDITEQKQSEMALIKSEQNFRSIIEASPLPLAMNDEHGNIIFLNREFVRAFGYTMSDIPTVEEWWPRAYPDPHYRQSIVEAWGRNLAEARRTNSPFTPMEIYVVRKNGSAGTYICTANSLGENLSGSHLVVFYDITERKKSEEEKAKLESQLQQSQKIEAVGRLAGGVAHDFNNMLGVIIGHSELALMKLEPSQPIYSSLTEIRKAAERSADLTRQLLAFARKQTIAPKVIDLNRAVTGMFNMLQRLIGENINLNLHSASNLWSVRVDPSQIDQMLANLCVNARDSIKDVGRITIETGNTFIDADYCATHAYVEPGEYVRLSVSDDGGGMDKETLAHIFEPFFTTKKVGEGTGLGLATVYGIIKQNNGFINVYSEPGHGTTFTIYLPRHKGESMEVLKESLPEPFPRGDETILLVEDESTILVMVAMMLEGQDYTVLTAGSAGEAIQLFKENPGKIQMLMTDVVMPDMNGRDLARELMSLNPQMKCLFMSGYTANVIAHHGVLDEGVYFIQKPFSLPDLSRKVREVLDGR